MAQIRESQFAVMRENSEDFDLMDLAGMGGVSVELEHEYYGDEFTERITQIDEGDIIYCQIQGEDILYPNAIWRFLEFEIIGHDPGWILD